MPADRRLRQKVRDPFRGIDDGEPAADAEQPGGGAGHILKGCQDFMPGNCPLRMGIDPAGSAFSVRGIADHKIHRSAKQLESKAISYLCG